MRAWSRSDARRQGLGALVAFVAWVVAIALIWALMQGSATSGALAGVIRVSGLSTLTLAGESALEEASIALRHARTDTSPVLEAIRSGADAGEAHDPRATRELFSTDVQAGVLKLEKVRYRVVNRGTDTLRDPYLIDLSVRVTFTGGSAAMTRLVSQRHTGRICHVRVVEGPRESAPIFSAFTMDRNFLLRVIEP